MDGVEGTEAVGGGVGTNEERIGIEAGGKGGADGGKGGGGAKAGGAGGGTTGDEVGGMGAGCEAVTMVVSRLDQPPVRNVGAAPWV